MNKIIYSLVLTTAFSFTSCENFLTEENPNDVTVQNYFSTENDVLRSVFGAYHSLRSNDCMGEGSTAYTEERSDNTGRLDNQSAAGEPFQFTNFSLQASNTYLKSHWDALYGTVSDANFALSGIKTVEFSNDEYRVNLEAEARFIRALAYFEIVRKWGDAPLITEYLSTPSEIKANTFREDKSKIFELIVEDLLYGLEKSSLPNHQGEGNKGRANKAVIAGMLGKVYLTMAHDLADEKRTDFLLEAKKYLEVCLSMKTFTSLSEITYDDNAKTGLFSVVNKSTCPEILFEIVYKQGDKDNHSSVAVDNQSVGIHINSQYQSKGQGTFVNEDLINEYEVGDQRKTFSVTFAEHPEANAWCITKFRDTSDAAGTLGYGGNNWIILRYADVYLMMAEALEALGQPSEAIKYLNEVRERAGMPGYEESLKDSNYQKYYSNLKFAILHERRIELAFENQRWYDLLRFFKTQDLIDYMHNKRASEYGISDLQNFSEKDIYYPIPFDEWKLNPKGMYQNNGYETNE